MKKVQEFLENHIAAVFIGVIVLCGLFTTWLDF